MSTQTIVSWLTQIFSDPQAAQNYANDPTQATQRELGDVDLSAVDMRQAVTDACQSAGINPDATEAIVNSMYQPAQTLRVPSERLTLNDDGYPERCDYTDLVNNYDDQSTVSEPCLVGPEQVAPPRMVDGDYGGKCVQPEELAPQTYYPGDYEPTGPMTEECVEYTVSNCVVVCHGDTPEIAETLCEERRYVDPYPREDPSHVCPTDTGGHCMPEWIPCDDLPEYDSEGYDQWGCDDQGYDRQGYDPTGCDRDGNTRPYPDSPEDDDRPPVKEYGDESMDDRPPVKEYGDESMDDRPPYEGYGGGEKSEPPSADDYGNGNATEPEETYGSVSEETYGSDSEETYSSDSEETYSSDSEETYSSDSEETYGSDNEETYSSEPTTDISEDDMMLD